MAVLREYYWLLPKTKNSFFSKKSTLAKTTFFKIESATRAKICVFWPELVFHTYIVNFLSKFWGPDAIFMSVFGLALYAFSLD